LTAISESAVLPPIPLAEQGEEASGLRSSKLQAATMRREAYFALAVATLAASAAPFNATAKAQTSKAWDQCIGREGPALDVVIEGCTAVIGAGQNTAAILGAAFNNRGFAYRLKGDYDHALEDDSQAIRLNPNAASRYSNRGVIFRIKKQYDRAIKDYDEAISLKSDFPAAYYNRALAYAAEGDYNHASEDFEVVLRFNAKNALALYARGLMRLKKGDTEAGKADIAAAKAIDPNVSEQYDHSE
jgi:tetratricopeptide (TPR) repeat protein